MDEAPDVDFYARGAWLFDEQFYLARYKDLTPERLERAQFRSAFDHFRRIGDRERRRPNLFFDPDYYLSQLPDEESAEAANGGAFKHFHMTAEAGVLERATSPYFDPAFYRARYQNEITMGALHHYFTNATPIEFDPLPEFSESFYLTTYPDVSDAVGSGIHRSGYLHFLKHGVFELRAPHRDIDLAWYARNHPQVEEDLKAKKARDAFAHFLTIGRKLGLPAGPSLAPLPSAAQAAALFRVRAEAMLPGLVRRGLDFSFTERPEVSVVISTRDRFALLMSMLASLRSAFSGAMEVILLDRGSNDETGLIERFVSGLQVLRFGEVLHLSRTLNAAMACAAALAILLIDDSMEFAPDALACALRRLNSGSPPVGAVGGMVLSPEGLVWEAGGAATGGKRPPLPEAGFVRDANFLSADFLLLRAGLIAELGGFDEALDESGEEVADLCRRIRAAGQRVVYDPAIVVQHTTELPVSSERNAALTGCGVPGRRRVLFIDDTVPLRMIGSGFVRSNDIIRSISALDLDVTVFPLSPCRCGPATRASDMPDDVEITADFGLEHLAGFLRERGSEFATVWIARTHNLDRVRPFLERAFGEASEPPLIVLDTEAISSFRTAERARLRGETFDIDTAIRQEFRNAAFCQRVIGVSAREAQALRDLGLQGVTVIGHGLEVQPSQASFAERAGMLFLGAIHEAESPNYDALTWFIDAVLPLIEQELRWETRLTVAGYVAPRVSLDQWRGHPRVTLLGPAMDPAGLYASHRIFVAPTRFAAGLPYKLHETAAFGLPAVATTLLAGQLGWADGEALLAADSTDSAAFAAQVVRLYRDQALWHSVRDGALRRLAEDASPARFEAGVREALGLATLIDTQRPEG